MKNKKDINYNDLSIDDIKKELNKEKLTENGFERLPAWQDALGRYLEELKKNDMF